MENEPGWIGWDKPFLLERHMHIYTQFCLTIDAAFLLLVSVTITFLSHV